MEIIEILGRQRLFEGLSTEALQAVAGRIIRRQLARDALLFREGEPCRGLYIVVRGRVMAYKASADGREQALDSAGPGQTIAELPLFDGGPYPASARAVENSELLFLSIDDFQQLYRKNPEIADIVIRRLGERLRKLVRLVGTLTLKDVPARVATRLLEYAATSGPLHNGASFVLARRHYELAAELATTRESITRALTKLREDGVISQKGSVIEILDLSRLRKVAGDSSVPMRIVA
jgi:CRP-like cAMP-binding protein